MPADLAVKPIDNIVSTNMCPVLKREIRIREGILNAFLYLLGSFSNFISCRDCTTVFAFSRAFLGMNYLENFGNNFAFGTRNN